MSTATCRRRKIKVSPRATNTVNLHYDQPGSVPLKFQTTGYSNNTITAEWNEFFIAYNTGMTTAKLYGTAGTKISTGEQTATSLFPFISQRCLLRGPVHQQQPDLRQRDRQRLGSRRLRRGAPDHRPPFAAANDQKERNHRKRRE